MTDPSGLRAEVVGQTLPPLQDLGFYRLENASGDWWVGCSLLAGRESLLDNTQVPDTSKPVGYWNKVHIIARGDDVEFWLNGRRTAKFTQGSEEWQALYQRSKFTDRPDYGSLRTGHIGLQDHMDKVWYRNLRVLVLPD